MIGTASLSGPSITAIFTPGRAGRSFHVICDGWSTTCWPTCCAVCCGPACCAGACEATSPKTPTKAAAPEIRLMLLSLEYQAHGNDDHVCPDSTPRKAPRQQMTGAAMCWQSNRLQGASDLRRLQDRLHGELTDLAAHLLPDPAREPVMEAGIDAGHCDFVRVGADVAVAPRDAGGGRTGHRDLWYVSAAQHCFDHRRNSSAADAVCARIFGVHRRVIDRQ